MEIRALRLIKVCGIVLCLYPGLVSAQVDFVPVDNGVYSFLQDLSVRGLIDYNDANIPITREQVASYLKRLDGERSQLTSVENEILNDFLVEYSYDIDKTTRHSFSLLSNLPGGMVDIFNDRKQKYLAFYADSKFSLFLDGIGALSYRDFRLEDSHTSQVLLGEIGPRLRCSYDDILGLYIHITGGKSLGGDSYSRANAALYDPLLTA
ncbi:MAG: hypothetical protein JRN15_11360, partial [Nitrososphaerota archaeon]|nr:hypothetical protein [Nitrososphaerota archaeon]